MKPVSIPPNYFYLGIFLSIVFYFIFPSWNLIVFPYNLIGSVLIVFGFFLIIYSWALFQKHGTPEDFSKSTALVTENLYSFSRNPMYLGAVIVLIGLSILLGNVLSFIIPVLFFIIIDRMFIPFEEEKNTKTFGKKFLDYKKRTRRWL